MKKLLLFIIGLFCCFLCQAQSDRLVVKDIIVEGNKKTRLTTILRELDFSIGDTLEQKNLTQRFETQRLYLINSGLFNKVELNIAELEGDQLIVKIDVQEDWYIYPLPILELADRNFNEWWTTHNHALNRLNFGLRFYWQNFTGRNDRLKLVTQFGYTQKYELDYKLPFFNKKQTLGLQYNIRYSRNREISFITKNDTLSYLRLDQEYSLKSFRTGLALTYRPKLLEQFTIGGTYYRNDVADPLRIGNPEFLNNQKNTQQYLSLALQFSSDHRDRASYALKGYFLLATMKKDGFGIFNDVNNLSLALTLAKYFSLNQKFSLEFIAKGKTNFIRTKQPYFLLQRALGYKNDFVRGYEYYVIDGQDFSFLKSGLRYELLNVNFSTKVVPLKALQYIPLKVYLKINSDIGYVNNAFSTPDNTLVNNFLWGFGPGIDIVLYHDYVVQIEYSFNRRGEKGLYLHYKFLL